VARAADDETIKKAYRKLALKFAILYTQSGLDGIRIRIQIALKNAPNILLFYNRLGRFVFI